MGDMGMPIGRAVQWAIWARCYKLLQILSHTIARCAIVPIVVITFGAHEMIAELKSLLVSIFWGCVAIGALIGYVAIAMYTIGPR